MKLAKAIRDALDRATRRGTGGWPIYSDEPAGRIILEAIAQLEAEEAKLAMRPWIEDGPAEKEEDAISTEIDGTPKPDPALSEEALRRAEGYAKSVAHTAADPSVIAVEDEADAAIAAEDRDEACACEVCGGIHGDGDECFAPDEPGSKEWRAEHGEGDYDEAEEASPGWSAAKERGKT